MSQNEKPTYYSSLKPRLNKIFIYGDLRKNVDFNLLKRNCKYFYDHRSEFRNKEEYEMKESINLPPSTVEAFLNCCQNKKTQIDDIFGVKYLSTKYQNEELLKFTQDYIENNYDELVFQSIDFKQQIQKSDIKSIDSQIDYDTTNEERIISIHLLQYLEDERIFKLSINNLDRVLKKFFEENKETCNEPTTKKRINDFLKNCLRKYGRIASILFLNVGFDKFDREMIVSLHNEFSNIFDFNMIDSKSLFETTYQLIGDVSQIQL